MEFVRAIICSGWLRWEYRLSGSVYIGKRLYPHSVADYTEEEIREITCREITVPVDEREQIEIIYE